MLGATEPRKHSFPKPVHLEPRSAGDAAPREDCAPSWRAAPLTTTKQACQHQVPSTAKNREGRWKRRALLLVSRGQRAKPASAPRMAFPRWLLRVPALFTDPQRQQAFQVTELTACPPSVSAQACLWGTKLSWGNKGKVLGRSRRRPQGLWGEQAGARESWGVRPSSSRHLSHK